MFEKQPACFKVSIFICLRIFYLDMQMKNRNLRKRLMTGTGTIKASFYLSGTNFRGY